MQHLEITNGGEGWFYCDPKNELYDALNLNSGFSTLFAPETAYTMRDRIFGELGISEIFRTNEKVDSMKDLFGVLEKWKDAVYMPPKQEQAFQQGGTFVFKGRDTLYAHYDASTGAHLSVENAVQIAVEGMESEERTQ